MRFCQGVQLLTAVLLASAGFASVSGNSTLARPGAHTLVSEHKSATRYLKDDARDGSEYEDRGGISNLLTRFGIKYRKWQLDRYENQVKHYEIKIDGQTIDQAAKTLMLAKSLPQFKIPTLEKVEAFFASSKYKAWSNRFPEGKDYTALADVFKPIRLAVMLQLLKFSKSQELRQFSTRLRIDQFTSWKGSPRTPDVVGKELDKLGLGEFGVRIWLEYAHFYESGPNAVYFFNKI